MLPEQPRVGQVEGLAEMVYPRLCLEMTRTCCGEVESGIGTRVGKAKSRP